jgi:hypothetical protein
MTKANGALRNRNLLISGASAAGPTLAYWPQRHGCNPTVVERHPSLKPGGYAIDVRGSAIGVAKQMGIWESIRKADTHLQEVLFQNTDHQVVATMDPNFGAGTGKAGNIELLRDVLAAILYGLTKHSVEYRFSNSIRSIEQDEDGVDVTFERGERRRFDLVVGTRQEPAHARHFHLRGVKKAVRQPEYSGAKGDCPAAAGGGHEMGNTPYVGGNGQSHRLLFRRMQSDQNANLVERASHAAGRCQFGTYAAFRAGDQHRDGRCVCARWRARGRARRSRTAFARYEAEVRPFVEQNQNIVHNAKETEVPMTWEEVDEQTRRLNALNASPSGEVPKGSLIDVIQTAANAYTLKSYERAVLRLTAGDRFNGANDSQATSAAR